MDTPLPIDMPEWKAPDWSHLVFARVKLREYVQMGLPLIRQAQRDGIPQVAPILVSFRAEPAAVKSRIGKGAWKRIHHADEMLNAWRARVRLTTRLDFATILTLPQPILRDVERAIAHSGECNTRLALEMTVANRRDFRLAVELIRDTIRMAGVVLPGWSLRRLREEHDLCARRQARQAASPIPFAAPWTREVDGFRFTRLISPADFVEEGVMQKHCVASYTSDAVAGQEITFRIEGRERATVSFSARGHVEIKAARNKAVSKPCRVAALEMFQAFKAEQSPRRKAA